MSTEATIRADERAKTLRSAAEKLWAAAAQLDPAMTNPALGSTSRSPAISEREFETLRAVAAGKSNGEIAQEQYISVETVKTRLRLMYRKLGVDDRAHAVAVAYETGLFLPAYVANQSQPTGHLRAAA